MYFQKGSDAKMNDCNSDVIAKLWLEYEALVNTLRKQGRRQSPELLMRLTVVMMDLGLYRPSPP